MLDWRERRIIAAGYSVAVFEYGNRAPDARTIVLVHGLGHWTQAAWDRLVPLLDPTLRIVAFDLPGFGSSDRPDVRYDTAFFARFIADALAQCASAPFVLVGHSLGGYIAAQYAAALPDRVERLVLIAPAGFLRSVRFIYALLGSQFARYAFTRRPSRAIVNRMLGAAVLNPSVIEPSIAERAYALAGEGAIRRAFAGVYTGAFQDFRKTRALHARLRAYTSPVLLVWGRHDRFIPIAGMAAAIAVYPHAKALVAENSRHLPMVEEPQLVADAIAAFLDH